MFEHFGLKDIFFVLKKSVGILVALWLLVGLVGAAVVASSVLAFDGDTQHDDSEKIYVSSASYYITPITKNDASGLQINMPGDSVSASLQLVTVYETMLKADFCKDYVYHKILTTYSPERFIELSGLRENRPDMKVSDFTLDTIANFISVSTLKGTSIINIFAQSCNAELSKTILDAYVDYLTIEIPKTTINATAEHLGGADQVLKSKMDSTGKAIESGSTTTRQIKYTIVAEIVVTFLFCIIVFVYALFFPTLNRKSDFDIYGIPVIGEITGKD